VLATENNVSKELKDKIVARYVKKLSRQAQAKKAVRQAWNKNRIKNDPYFKK
jgi:hypothetical protein